MARRASRTQRKKAPHSGSSRSQHSHKKDSRSTSEPRASKPARSARPQGRRSSESFSAERTRPNTQRRFEKPKNQAGFQKTSHPQRTSLSEGSVLVGRVDLHPDGFGFLIPQDIQYPNIYLPEETLRSVMHRDEVKVRVERSFEGGSKLRGSVVAILKRTQKEFLGLYRPYKGGALVIPSEARDRRQAFKVSSQPPGEQYKSGDVLLCKIVGYPDKGHGSVDILSRVEDPTAPSQDTLRLLIESGWPRVFSKAAVQDAEQSAEGWKKRLRASRKDIRSLPLVTIDGRDAKDFDDAVYARKEGNGYRLWVAIADVSTFVQSGSALDREAFERATSMYLPDHVIPMLPEVLSNGVCSLNPFEDRACLVCEAFVDAQGKIRSYTFYEGLMQSHRRLTYEDMQAFIEGQVWATDELAALTEPLKDLQKVFELLHRARQSRGAIDLDIPEAKVLLNRDGTVYDIQSRERLDSHRLIEECMLAANECAAKFLHEKGEGVYRIHEPPDPKRLEDLKKFIALCGLEVPDLEEPGDFSQLLKKLSKNLDPQDPTLKAVSILVLRSLKQARYSTVRVGHFALANKDYTHFTSPIRRYPDLIVHRLIKQALRLDRHLLPSGVTELEQACQHCSDQERAAMDCERKVIDTKKCRYMEAHLGEDFEAWVSGVTEKGLFCQIEGHFVDGLLSAEALDRSIRHRFDATQMVYVGPGKSRIGLGTRLIVQVAAVDPMQRRIDFAFQGYPEKTSDR